MTQKTINSIFSAIELKSEISNLPFNVNHPYDSIYKKELKVFNITYKTDTPINNIEELEFEIANKYFKKKYGKEIKDLKIEKLKELYPEIFLV